VLQAVVNRAFLPTATGIYFFTSGGRNRPYTLQFLEFKTDRIETIAQTSKPVQSGLTISPDGKILLYSQVDQNGSEIMLAENFR